MNDQGQKTVRPRRMPQSFSLAALFLLITLAAVVTRQLAAMIQQILSEGIAFSLAWIPLVSALCGGFWGAVIGLFHFRPARGLGWGLVVGVACGPIFGMLATLVVRQPLPGLGTLCGLAAVILMFGFYRRRTNKVDPSQNAQDYQQLLTSLRAQEMTKTS